MKTLLVFPFSRLLNNGAPNPKNYPLMGEVVSALRGKVHTIQLGTQADTRIGCDESCMDLPVEELVMLGRKADAFLSVDSFFPHLAAAMLPDIKGVVVWIVTKHTQYGYERFRNVYAVSPTAIPPEFSVATMEGIAEGLSNGRQRVNLPNPRKVTDAIFSEMDLTR